MTLPAERKNALHSAKEFLRSLLDPSRTKRVPREIRQEAGRKLKHYPSHYEIDQMAKGNEKLLGNRMQSEEYEQLYDFSKRDK